MAKPNTPKQATPVDTDALPVVDNLLDVVESDDTQSPEAIKARIEAKKAELAAKKQADADADKAARTALAQLEIVDSIKALSADKATILTNVVKVYSVYGNGLQPVAMPSKLAGSTEGKVIQWIMENPSKLIALHEAVSDDNATKTGEQINAKVVGTIKAYVLVKPYLACF